MRIHLCAEGEYGRRLVRYLEKHLDSNVSLRHFTHPDQWMAGDDGRELMIMSRSFFQGLSSECRGALDEDKVLWITDQEEEDGYCMFHPPEELRQKILAFPLSGERGLMGGSRNCEITAVFTPVPDPELPSITRTYMQASDLCLGMEDVGEDSGRNHMGDLCYYIHLRDPDIILRTRELSQISEDGAFIPSSASFLPLLELGPDDYRWFFDCLKASSAYTHVFIGVGNGMMCGRGLLPCLDRVILVSSRVEALRQSGCRMIAQSLQTGYEGFSGRCDMVFREDYKTDA